VPEPRIRATVPAVAVTVRVNEVDHRLDVDARVTLLDALRDVIGLTEIGRAHV